jgi:hypothetical protein
VFADIGAKRQTNEETEMATEYPLPSAGKNCIEVPLAAPVESDEPSVGDSSIEARS